MMNRRGPNRCFRRLTLLALVGLAGAALGAPAATAADILPVAEVRPGMKGVGRTVFAGDTIETFEVEVVDVLHRVFAGQDLILVRCKHPVLERANVIAGMSGSPIYLEGKLAGALAYAWGFAKEPLAGVTPIEYMLREGERPLEKTGALPPGDGRGAVPPGIGPLGLEPCETPLVLGGFARGAAELLAESLRPWRIVPVQGGGGGGAAPGRVITPEPGGAIAVQLLRGDLEAAAVGTITHVADGRIWAFGHPFLESGETSLPMAAAWVHAVIPSLARSFKLASSANPLGAIVQDRNPCILGRTDRTARMIPVRVAVANPGTGRRGEFRFEAVEHEQLTPALANAAVLSALEVTEEASGENTVESRVTAEVEGYEPVTWSEAFAGRGRVGGPAFLGPLARILRYPHDKARLRRLEVELTVRMQAAAAELKSAWWVDDAVRPGAVARLVCLLRPFRGPLETMTLELPVPGDLEPDTVLKVTVGAGPTVAPDVGPTVRLREFLEEIRRAHPGNTLVARASLPGQVLRLAGVEHRGLPNSVLGAWIPGILEEAELDTEVLRVVAPAKYVLTGTQTLKLRIVR
ncbi:MAG: hypothetical protein HZA54_10410 [Planctomycetes bacterium]|nr:hypothetical protein [Planctomycetota bacterium]